MGDKRITDEQELIAGCIEGKSWAQRAIYDRFAPAMMSVCGIVKKEKRRTRLLKNL